MSLFTLEHSKVAYRLDLALFGGASVGLGALLFLMGPHARLIQSIACAALGFASWTLIEYGLHRFLLHGVKPFSTWHAEHHRRPAARIYSPTLLSVTLIVVLIYLPAWIVGGSWPACALTFGVVAGDFGYAVTHHAVHHWDTYGGWLWRRRRWHALHHARSPAGGTGRPGYYGVTSPFWDHVFRTAGGRSGRVAGGAAADLRARERSPGGGVPSRPASPRSR
jgi:sterol desaturase/sphingolipid hydroxylase (fatty acid hydroxylase superfamily)